MSQKGLNIVGKIWEKGGKLNYRAFSEVALNIAESITNERTKDKKLNNPSQLRKFYDVIFNLNQRSKMLDEQDKQNEAEIERKWNAILVQLHRQLALVHYAKGRNLVSDSFVKMMDELIGAVEKREHLQVITDFLEAFMAFYKELNPRN